MKTYLLLILPFLLNCSEIQQPGLTDNSGNNSDLNNGGGFGGGGDYDWPDQPLIPPPSKPDNLFGTPIVENGIRTGVQISWQDNATNETGYIIEWYPNNLNLDDFGQVTLDSNTSTFDTRSKSIPAETHYFALYAYNDGGKSETVRLVVP